MNEQRPFQRRRTRGSRRIVRILLVLVVVLVGAGFLYENVSESRDRRFNPPTGRRFDVGGYKMHIDCTGQGSPTVVLESGLGDTYISWRKVQPQISKFARVCSYDRAGLGYSKSSSRPRTSKVIAEELHALLRGGGHRASLRAGRPFDGRIPCARLCQPLPQRGCRSGAGRRFPSGPGESFSTRAQEHGRELDAREPSSWHTRCRWAFRDCSICATTIR